MAFSGSHNISSNGASFPSAYAKVAECNLNYADNVGRISVNIYADAAARANGLGPVDQVSYDFGAAVTEEVDEEGQVVVEGKPGFSDVFNITNLNAANANPVKAAYQYMRTHQSARWTSWQDV